MDFLVAIQSIVLITDQSTSVGLVLVVDPQFSFVQQSPYSVYPFPACSEICSLNLSTGQKLAKGCKEGFHENYHILTMETL